MARQTLSETHKRGISEGLRRWHSDPDNKARFKALMKEANNRPSINGTRSASMTRWWDVMRAQHGKSSLTLDDLYGRERALKIKENLSESGQKRQMAEANHRVEEFYGFTEPLLVRVAPLWEHKFARRVLIEKRVSRGYTERTGLREQWACPRFDD